MLFLNYAVYCCEIWNMWFSFNRWKNNKLLVLSNIIAKDQFPLTTELDESNQLLHKALFILTKATTIKILSTYCAKMHIYIYAVPRFIHKMILRTVITVISLIQVIQVDEGRDGLELESMLEPC